MSSFFGAWIAGKRRRSTAMISPVSSTESVVCVMYASRRVGGEVERFRLGDVLHEHRRIRRLAHRADDLLVAGMADQDDGVAVRRVAPRLHVHLRHERAGRVDDVVAERLRGGVHGGSDAVRGEDDRRADGRLGLGVDEDRAAGLELAHDVDVVDDLLAHVDRRAVVLERELHRLDRALDPGAVAAGRREENAFDHIADRSLDPRTRAGH